MATDYAIVPEGTGEQKLVLRLSQDTLNPRAFSIVAVEIDYSACNPEGVVLPLDVTILGPSASSFKRSRVTRTRPSALLFRPTEGGEYLIRVSEVAHNQWWGALTIKVEGEIYDQRRLLQ